MNRKKTNYNLCDLNREGRTNIPEVVYARSKHEDSLIDAIDKLFNANNKVLITKCSKDQLTLIKKRYNKYIIRADVISGTVFIAKQIQKINTDYTSAVFTAGSSDYFVGEEAAITLEFFGFNVYRYYDCGVAGIHRLAPPIEEISKNRVDIILVVAGMDGALPSIIAGLVKQPVIAVPTSIGYGSSLKGLAALLTMLNSCSPGICVVNIDNGFGAAACAFKMVKWIKDSVKFS